MATIHTKIEKARGCGFRKPGGFYLVVDGKGIICGLLPLDLNPDIKTSRAPQWRTSEESIGKPRDRKCRFRGQESDCKQKCRDCWLRRLPSEELVLLTFVGMTYYKTTQQFEREAGRYGISRRIPPSLVHKIQVGKTAVLLAHREASHRPTEDGLDFEPVRQVFAAFKPQRIEYIVTGQETEEELNTYEEAGITLIRVKKAGKVLDLGLTDQSN